MSVTCRPMWWTLAAIKPSLPTGWLNCCRSLDHAAAAVDVEPDRAPDLAGVLAEDLPARDRALAGEHVAEQPEAQPRDRRARERRAQHVDDVTAVRGALIDLALAHPKALDDVGVEVDRVRVVEHDGEVGHPGGAHRVDDEPHRTGRT